MTFFTIFSIVVIVLFITAMLAAAYFALKAVLTGDVSQLVALAEMTALPGPEKMAQVVASMYQHVPKAFRAILTEERLEAIAQGIFNWMRKYAEEYISAIKKPEPAPASIPARTSRSCLIWASWVCASPRSTAARAPIRWPAPSASRS